MVRSDRFFGVTAALAIKAPCRAVTTLADHPLNGLADVEGITIVENDRVLVTAQLDPIENGIYNASSSDWQRSADFDGQRDVTKGTIVSVNVPIGTITSYVVDSGIAGQAIAIDTDPVTFSIFFAQTSSIDDLGDVDTTGCSDDDLMYWSGGVLICTLGALTYDGDELLNDGQIGIKGFNNAGPTLRARESDEFVATLGPRRNDPYSGIGGQFGELAFLHDFNATQSFRSLLLRKFSDGIAQRVWNVQGQSADPSQTQGDSKVSGSLVRVTAVANPDDSITLADPELGLEQIILNLGVNRLQIWPEVGDDLGLGANVPAFLPPGGAMSFMGIDASTWHTQFVGDGSAAVPGAFRGARVYHNADFDPPDNTAPTWSAGGPPGAAEAAMPWNQEVFDTDTIHDTAVNNSRLTTPAGVSRIVLKAGITMTDADTGGMHVRFRLNGTLNAIDGIQTSYIPHATHGSWGSVSGDPDIANIGFLHDSGVIQVQNPGTDYYECYMLGQGNLALARANKCWFQMEIIE